MSCPYYTFRSNDYYCTKKTDYVNSDDYYKYCRNYDYRDCPVFKAEDTTCYLTSACVEARGLPDDCRELMTLRKFRDEWLRRQDGGEAEIREYYRIAPAIVAAIGRREDAPVIWERLYRELVAPCVALIDGGRMEEAHCLYRTTARQLETEFVR